MYFDVLYFRRCFRPSLKAFLDGWIHCTPERLQLRLECIIYCNCIIIIWWFLLTFKNKIELQQIYLRVLNVVNCNLSNKLFHRKTRTSVCFIKYLNSQNWFKTLQCLCKSYSFQSQFTDIPDEVCEAVEVRRHFFT